MQRFQKKIHKTKKSY